MVTRVDGLEVFTLIIYETVLVLETNELSKNRFLALLFLSHVHVIHTC